VLVTARRAIASGEQLSIDYATCDTTWVALEKCECGSALVSQWLRFDAATLRSSHSVHDFCHAG